MSPLGPAFGGDGPELLLNNLGEKAQGLPFLTGVEIDAVSEGLDGGDDSGRKRAPGQGREIPGQAPGGQAAELPQEPAVVAEEEAEHLGDGEDDPQPILVLESTLILGQETIKVMKEHLVEDGELWMSGTVDSCLSGCRESCASGDSAGYSRGQPQSIGREASRPAFGTSAGWTAAEGGAAFLPGRLVSVFLSF